VVLTNTGPAGRPKTKPFATFLNERLKASGSDARLAAGLGEGDSPMACLLKIFEWPIHAL